MTLNKKGTPHANISRRIEKVEDDKRQTKELEKAIKELVMQPNVYDTLRKAAMNGITAKVNGGFTRLEVKNYDPRWNQLGYTFYMEQPEQIKPMLTAHIDLLTDGTSLYIEHYDNNQLTKEQVLRTLESTIGLDEEE